MGRVAFTLTAHQSSRELFKNTGAWTPFLVLLIGQDRTPLVVKTAELVLTCSQGKDTLV